MQGKKDVRRLVFDVDSSSAGGYNVTITFTAKGSLDSGDITAGLYSLKSGMEWFANDSTQVLSLSGQHPDFIAQFDGLLEDGSELELWVDWPGNVGYKYVLLDTYDVLNGVVYAYDYVSGNGEEYILRV